MNASVVAAVRLYTLTWKPRLSTFSTRFWPITARPIRPKSLFLSGLLLLKVSPVCGAPGAQW